MSAHAQVQQLTHRMAQLEAQMGKQATQLKNQGEVLESLGAVLLRIHTARQELQARPWIRDKDDKDSWSPETQQRITAHRDALDLVPQAVVLLQSWNTEQAAKAPAMPPPFHPTIHRKDRP